MTESCRASPSARPSASTRTAAPTGESSAPVGRRRAGCHRPTRCLRSGAAGRLLTTSPTAGPPRRGPRSQPVDLDVDRLDLEPVGAGRTTGPGSRGRGPTKPATKSSAGSRAARPARPPARAGRPRRSTATWSPSLTASSMSWVTRTMVLPSSPWSRRNSCCSCVAHDRVDRRERLVHQHDRRVRRQGAGDARRAAAARRRAAPGSGPPSRRSSPTRSSSSSARVRASLLRRPGSTGTVATLSTTVRCGNRPAFWMTYPIPRRSSAASMLVMSSPSIRIAPGGGVDHPVDHPQRGGLAAARRVRRTP